MLCMLHMSSALIYSTYHSSCYHIHRKLQNNPRPQSDRYTVTHFAQERVHSSHEAVIQSARTLHATTGGWRGCGCPHRQCFCFPGHCCHPLCHIECLVGSGPASTHCDRGQRFRWPASVTREPGAGEQTHSRAQILARDPLSGAHPSGESESAAVTRDSKHVSETENRTLSSWAI